jgi:DNA gyrase subunit B
VVDCQESWRIALIGILSVANCLVEGDSAGTAKKVVTALPSFHCVENLNVEKAMEHKIYENEEIRNMYTAFRVPVEPEDPKALNLNKLRYFVSNYD